jgi:multidrug transporter EmrE-like cation transporter
MLDPASPQYGVSLVVWIAALTRVPVTVAYPMLSIGYVINALIARYWLEM